MMLVAMESEPVGAAQRVKVNETSNLDAVQRKCIYVCCCYKVARKHIIVSRMIAHLMDLISSKSGVYAFAVTISLDFRHPFLLMHIKSRKWLSVYITKTKIH